MRRPEALRRAPEGGVERGALRWIGPLAALAALAFVLVLPPAAAPEEVPPAGEAPAPAEADGDGEERLPEPLSAAHREWLESVALIITDAERQAFLALERTYQREAFIERFWRQRDPYPDTARNEFRERWERNVAFARSVFGGLDDERSRVLLLNGEPALREVIDCLGSYWPLEVWFYPDGSTLYRDRFAVIFYQRWRTGPYRIWHPMEGVSELQSFGDAAASEGSCLGDRYLSAALRWINALGGLGYAGVVTQITRPAEEASGEWASTFASYTTELPPGAEAFDAELAVDYPGWYQNRTVVQGTILVPLQNVARAEFAGHSSYNFQLTGEVLREGKLFDNFRYRFDPPGDAFTAGGLLPLVFQRYLRPGEPYVLVVKLEDLNARKYYRAELEIAVPRVESRELPPPSDPVLAQVLAEANAALAAGETVIKIIPPMGDMHAGMVRFQTLITGDGAARVVFSLGGQQIFTKNRPPYSVELDLGPMPRAQVLRAVAYAADGDELASDEFLVNSGGANRFRVRLIEPQRGKSYVASLRARAEVEVPEGDTVERVEYYLNEDLVATLFQPPWAQPIVLPQGAPLVYVRAVAYLTDGSATEDVVFVNAPDYTDALDVQLVELYTSVLDDGGRPVEGLTEADFEVSEDGVRQAIRRFEQVRDRPFHALILLDVSASMEASLAAARRAALAFFEEAVEPKDRAAIITFNDRPYLAAQFTNRLPEFAGGLAGLKAERGTALYDSVIYSLFFFTGVKGQRALLILSDGEDESSRFDYEQALEYARRAGITIYPIGLALPKKATEAKKKLQRFADETGGRSFFIDSIDRLSAVYATIQRDLRSQYLIAYQSSNTSGDHRFRTVELEVDRRGVEVRTLRGYYP